MFKIFSKSLKSSISFLISPKEWKTSYDTAKEYFPHLKTLIIDDIEIDKITKFISKTRKEEQVYQIISVTAIIVGAIAFVPGQMGPAGIYTCRAVEAYMAYEIAKTVGLKPTKDNIVKLILATGITTVSVIWIMKSFIEFFFSFTAGLFVPAVILATNFLGIFFWLAFEELSKFKNLSKLSFGKSLIIASKAVKLAYNLGKAQIKIIGNIGSKLKKLSKNILSIVNFKRNHEQLIKGDLFFALSLARLLENKCDSFNGFNGQMILTAWRKSYPSALGENASCEQIAKFVQSYSPDQLEGLQKPVKGKLFEIYENYHENNDGDQYKSELYEDSNHPRVDLKITDINTGKSLGIQLKASENKNYIDSTLKKYPDTEIIVPKGVAEKINHPLVSDSSISLNELNNINDEGFEKLLDINHGEYLAKGGIQAGTVVLFVNLMPFIYARFNKQISNDQLTVALKKFIPDLTAKTIHRVTLLSMIGPLYAFFLITKAIGKTFVNDIDFEEEEIKPKKKGMSRREFMLLFTPKLI